MLIIENNFSLTGPLPTSLTNLSLFTFWFDNTDLCEPADPDFQGWLLSVPNLLRTGVLCSSTFACNQVTEIPQLECEALVELYDSTNGTSWTNNTNWLITNTLVIGMA